ncbi:MAG: hypothetical protein AB7U38_01040 [Hyphomicrobiales bacterium]
MQLQFELATLLGRISYDPVNEPPQCGGRLISVLANLPHHLIAVRNTPGSETLPRLAKESAQRLRGEVLQE